MLESLQNQHQTTLATTAKPAKIPKILRYVENERMGGKIPVWETVKTPQNQIETNLSNAQNAQNNPSEALLAYNGNIESYEKSSHNQEFGFGDLVDMVNPLHHIPLVGHVYRELTGDTIHPIGQIIGGAVFGGPMGVASGLVNTIVEEETGKDVAGNAVAMMFDGEAPKFKNTANIEDTPEKRLNEAAQSIASNNPYEDLPGNLLSFADLQADPGIKIERVSGANERTAGPITQITHKDKDINLNVMPAREPITQVRLSGLYALGE